jgi:hypothetical protein
VSKIAKKEEKPKEKKDENESFLERIMSSKLVRFFEMASRALESLTTKLNEELAKIKKRIIKFLIVYTFLIAGVILFFFGIGWYLSAKFNIFNNGLGFVFVGFILIIATLPIILSSAKH